MSSKDPLYYEKLGENFDEFMSEYDVIRRRELILKRFLKAESGVKFDSILEVGCGTGKISSGLRQLTDHLTVNDISEKLAGKVAAENNCSFVGADCAQIPLADESFDLIVSSECIEHTPDPYKSLLEMKRLLKKSGLLVVTTPNMFWYPSLVIALALKLRKFQGTENWTWPFGTKKWLKENGFSDITFDGCHLFPWQIPLLNRTLKFFDNYGRSLYPIMINYGFCARKNS